MRTRDRARLQKAIDGCEWMDVYWHPESSAYLSDVARAFSNARNEMEAKLGAADLAAFDTMTRAIATRLLGECK